MNYVDNVKAGVCFINIEVNRSKPVHIDPFYNGYDHGYDLYQTLEYGRKFIKNNDFGFKANLLMKKTR